MANAKLLPMINPFQVLLPTPVAYARYTEINAIEHGDRKVAIPRMNKPV